MTGKKPFDIRAVLRRIRAAVRSFPRAALFELEREGYGSPFEQLVACIVSIRTRDEVTLPAARRLFARGRTAAAVAALAEGEIDALIRPATFHARKARQIRVLARRVASEHGGAVPCDAEALRSFEGVGPKCVNLVLGIACGQARIAVDVHVHRVTNRWGYVRTRTPEQTTAALESKLPRRDWIRLNALLVPFGKHICTGRLPHCSTCPVLVYCRQVGVTAHR